MVCVGFHFTLPLLRLGLFISTTADADPIVVLGFAVLLVGQVRKIQAALFIDRLALLIQTGRAALPRPIDTGPSTFPGYQRVGGPVRSPSRRLSTRNPSPRAGASGNETRVASVRNQKSKIENPKSCVGPSAILTGSRTRPGDWGSKARFGPVEHRRNNRRLAAFTCALCVLQIWWLSTFSSWLLYSLRSPDLVAVNFHPVTFHPVSPDLVAVTFHPVSPDLVAVTFPPSWEPTWSEQVPIDVPFRFSLTQDAAGDTCELTPERSRPATQSL